MSGGHFDYNCFRISQFAEEVQREIDSNTKKDRYEEAYNISPKCLALIQTSQKIIESAGRLAKEIEWRYSERHWR